MLSDWSLKWIERKKNRYLNVTFYWIAVCLHWTFSEDGRSLSDFADVPEKIQVVKMTTDSPRPRESAWWTQRQDLPTFPTELSWSAIPMTWRYLLAVTTSERVCGAVFASPSPPPPPPPPPSPGLIHYLGLVDALVPWNISCVLCCIHCQCV